MQTPLRLNVRSICGDFDFLGSRDSGEKLRSRIVKETQCSRTTLIIELDFEGIEEISHSFADEVFGLITARFGTSFIKKHITLLNTNENIKIMFNFAIRGRLQKNRENF